MPNFLKMCNTIAIDARHIFSLLNLSTVYFFYQDERYMIL